MLPPGRLFKSASVELKLKPDFALAYSNLGAAWERQKDSAKARAAYEKAIHLQPSLFKAHYNLGTLLAKQRSLDQAEKHLREAIRLKPDYADALSDLGNILTMRGRTDEAIQSYRKALKYAPNEARIWLNLSFSQARQRRFDEAAASCEKALSINPNDAGAHSNLGFCRIQQRRLSEAVVLLRKAVALQPNSFNANANLADVLSLQGKAKEVIPVYRKMIELHPSPDTRSSLYHSLGAALLRSGELTQAKAAWEQALKLKPDHAAARAGLVKVLWRLGQFEEAKDQLTKASDLSSLRDSEKSQILAALRDCDRMIRATGKLPAIQKGEAKPADKDERIWLADYCMHVKRQYALAASLLAEGFAADNKMVEDRQNEPRFRAACAAVQAAAGRDEDGTLLDEKARLRWRKQALEWLRADLTAWQKRAETGSVAERSQAREAAQRWRQEAHLAAVRESDQRIWLPEDERKSWQKLWSDVDRLCKKAGE